MYITGLLSIWDFAIQLGGLWVLGERPFEIIL